MRISTRFGCKKSILVSINILLSLLFYLSVDWEKMKGEKKAKYESRRCDREWHKNEESHADKNVNRMLTLNFNWTKRNLNTAIRRSERQEIKTRNRKKPWSYFTIPNPNRHGQDKMASEENKNCKQSELYMKIKNIYIRHQLQYRIPFFPFNNWNQRSFTDIVKLRVFLFLNSNRYYKVLSLSDTCLV